MGILPMSLAWQCEASAIALEQDSQTLLCRVADRSYTTPLVYNDKAGGPTMSRTATTKWSPVTSPSKSRPRYSSTGSKHWRESCEFYDRNKSRLLKDPRYSGKYVAIRHKRVVDVDTDKIVLAHRLMERFPDHKFFVTQVLKVEPVIDVPGFVIAR